MYQQAHLDTVNMAGPVVSDNVTGLLGTKTALAHRVEPLHSESESEPTSNDKLPVISHNILISFAFGCGRPLRTRNPLHSLHGLFVFP